MFSFRCDQEKPRPRSPYDQLCPEVVIEVVSYDSHDKMLQANPNDTARLYRLSHHCSRDARRLSSQAARTARGDPVRFAGTDLTGPEKATRISFQ
jgi:hypothetical protein